MLAIHCSHCDQTYLLGTSAIQSLHNTSEGPVIYAKCPHGHAVVSTRGSIHG